MEVFDDVEYKELEPEELGGSDIFAETGISLIGVKKRSRSEFDSQLGVWWILTDILSETEQFGRPYINRLVVLKKEDDTGTVQLRLRDSIQKAAVMTANYKLPSDFSPRDEAIEGLRILAEAGHRDD